MGDSPNSSNKLVSSTKKIIMSMKLAKLPAVIEQVKKENEDTAVKGVSHADEEIGKAIREAFLEKREPVMHQSSLEESSPELKVSVSTMIYT
jgi:hypothetical protein